MKNRTNRLDFASFQRVMLCLAGMAFCALAVGCESSGYSLKGKVVRGGFTDIEVVDDDDEHLEDAGLGEARILIHRDPNTLKRQLIATGRSNSDGTFSIPISAFGAGWMDEVWLIQVECSGYRSGDNIIRLPGFGKRLLITMAKGQSVPHEQQENLWEEYEKYK